MKIPWYVKPKPWFINYIPFLGRYTANSLYPIIIVPKHVYKDLQTENPNPRHMAILLHEETHRKRQKQLGLLNFGLKYIFNPKFRFNEELLAVKEGMKYLKKQGISFDFDRSASFMSGYLYLWPVSKTYAKEKLKKVWDEV